MADLHINSKTTVIIDDVEHVVADLDQMFNLLNIPNTEEYHDARVSIVQKMMVFREVDLSKAYPGHTVLIHNLFY